MLDLVYICSTNGVSVHGKHASLRWADSAWRCVPVEHVSVLHVCSAGMYKNSFANVHWMFF